MIYPTTNPKSECKCGHPKEQHYHGRGMCEVMRNFCCNCQRFRKVDKALLRAEIEHRDREDSA